MKANRILVVDDNPKNVQVLAVALSEQGYEVEYTSNGVDALKLVESEDFDLILLDIMMPEMDGFEVCSKIKQIENKSDTPIIFITARTDIESITRGFELGGVDYITKPFNQLELLSRVKTHLELVMKNKQIIRKNEELDELNRTKDKFFSIVAHDLKNPLVAISMKSNMIQDFGVRFEKDELLEEFKGILEQVDHIVKMCINLLDWSRLQAQGASCEPEFIQLKHLFDEVVTFHSEQADQKSISINNSISENTTAYADKEQLRTVFRNLISNAIKFSPQGKNILLSAKTYENQVISMIQDEGIGIPAKLIPELFKLDSNTSRPGTNKEKGTGLGLLLVKDFVEMNKGKIEVESEEGKGTLFKVYFPISNKD